MYSEVSDHTSTIQFIEKRFNVSCPNVSPWRRAVTSDLTAAFNWSAHDPSWPALPSTSSNTADSRKQCKNNPPPVIPTVQSMPVQETGTRLQRPLPYAFNVSDVVRCVAGGAGTAVSLELTITIQNTGAAGAVFYVYDKVTAVQQTQTPVAATGVVH